MIHQDQLISLSDGTLKGFIKLSNKTEYFIDINLHANRFKCDRFLERKLSSYPDQRTKLLGDATSNADVIDRLVAFLESVIVPRPLPLHRNLAIIEEIVQLPDHIIKSMDDNFNTITLQCLDEGGRTHYLTVDMTTSPLSLTALLPHVPPAVSSCTLTDLYEGFVAQVSGYQDVWEVLEEVERGCWVVEPPPPSYHLLHRRIMLVDGVSLLLTFSPLQPRSLPRFSFLGPTDAVQVLQDRLEKRTDLWNPGNTVPENLANILQMELPEAPVQGEKGAVPNVPDCGICYVSELEGELPVFPCSSCTQVYHLSCLTEWFKGLPNLRQCFGTVFGECPYCSEPMHVQLTL